MTGNQIQYTTNAGNNWTQQIPDPIGSGTIQDIYFINGQTGWAGTFYQRIYKTTNGGTNWGYQNDTSCSYRISIVDSSHGWTGSNGISHTTNGGGNIVSVKQISSEIPQNYKLYQNYPNPFNPTTKIKFQVAKLSNVQLKAFDILGREIASLVNEKLKIGSYEYDFNATDLPSGTYFYKLTTDGYTETKKMILLK